MSGEMMMLQVHCLLRIHWRRALVVALIVLTAAGLWVRSWPRVHDAVVTLRVIPAGSDAQDYSEGMTGQLVRIKSPAVLQPVMTRLDLIHDKAFVRGFDGPRDQLLLRVQRNLRESVHLSAGGDHQIHISATHPSAARAAQIANAVAHQYLRLADGSAHGTLPCTAPAEDDPRDAPADDPGSVEHCVVDSQEDVDRAHQALARLSAKVHAAEEQVTRTRAQRTLIGASIIAGDAAAVDALEQKLAAARHARRTLEARPSRARPAAAVAKVMDAPRVSRNSTLARARRVEATLQALVDAARLVAGLEAARNAYFTTLDCYTDSRSLCLPVKAPRLAELVAAAATPPQSGGRGTRFLLAFLASAVLTWCWPAYELRC